MSKPISLVVLFDDGSNLNADGPHAAEVWEWYQRCEQLALAHGWTYKGSMLNSFTPETLIDDTVPDGPAPVVSPEPEPGIQ